MPFAPAAADDDHQDRVVTDARVTTGEPVVDAPGHRFSFARPSRPVPVIVEPILVEPSGFDELDDIDADTTDRETIDRLRAEVDGPSDADELALDGSEDAVAADELALDESDDDVADEEVVADDQVVADEVIVEDDQLGTDDQLDADDDGTRSPDEPAGEVADDVAGDEVRLDEFEPDDVEDIEDDATTAHEDVHEERRDDEGFAADEVDPLVDEPGDEVADADDAWHDDEETPGPGFAVAADGETEAAPVEGAEDHVVGAWTLEHDGSEDADEANGDDRADDADASGDVESGDALDPEGDDPAAIAGDAPGAAAAAQAVPPWAAEPDGADDRTTAPSESTSPARGSMRIGAATAAGLSTMTPVARVTEAPHRDLGGTVLHLEDLSKRYGDTFAVEGITLDVRRGSFTGIVGPNGAGKTTTLSMATGLLKPTSGTVEVLGIDVWADPTEARARIGILPDRLRLFDQLTGGQLLYYTGVLRGLGDDEARARAESLVQAFELGAAANRLVVDYSAGMTKKVALAAALIHSPELLVLDEPFESIDPVSAVQLTDILFDYVGRGGTVILSSHSMDLVQRVCDHVAVIVKGELLAAGTVDEVRGDITLEERFRDLVRGPQRTEGLDWLGISFN